MGIRQFDPSEDGDDSVHQDGESHADPAMSIELTPMKRTPKVSRTQARAAANLKFLGASYEEIADTLDYKDAAIARQVVEAHLAKAFGDESHESLFKITAARLEDLYKLARAKADPMVQAYDEYGDEIPGFKEKNPEQLAYMRAALDVVGRQMKLHGLEAPTKVEVTPDMERFEEVVQRMTAQVRGDEAVEVDVVEYAEIEAAVPGEFDDDEF